MPAPSSVMSPSKVGPRIARACALPSLSPSVLFFGSYDERLTRFLKLFLRDFCAIHCVQCAAAVSNIVLLRYFDLHVRLVCVLHKIPRVSAVFGAECLVAVAVCVFLGCARAIPARAAQTPAYRLQAWGNDVLPTGQRDLESAHDHGVVARHALQPRHLQLNLNKAQLRCLSDQAYDVVYQRLMMLLLGIVVGYRRVQPRDLPQLSDAHRLIVLTGHAAVAAHLSDAREVLRLPGLNP